MNEIRCETCGKLLARIHCDAVEVKCPKCKTFNRKFIQLADVTQAFKNPQSTVTTYLEAIHLERLSASQFQAVAMYADGAVKPLTKVEYSFGQLSD